MEWRPDRVWPAALLLGAALTGCTIEAGPSCPTDVMAEPNGREQTLFFVGGGYVQNGLWKQLTIPGTVQPDSFTVTTGSVEFHEPVCVFGSSGFPLIDENGELQCEWDVDASTTSNTCTLPAVQQDLDGLTVETTPQGTNVVLGVQMTAQGIAIQVGCDLSLTGGFGDPDPKCAQCDSGVHVVLRDPDGDIRLEDTIWLTCDEAETFGLNFHHLASEPGGAGEPVVHVGDEFYVIYYMRGMSYTSSSTVGHTLMGHGMTPVDANPAFEIVAYEKLVANPPRLLLRALAPAVNPRIRAGTIEAEIPVTILAAP